MAYLHIFTGGLGDVTQYEMGSPPKANAPAATHKDVQANYPIRAIALNLRKAQPKCVSSTWPTWAGESESASRRPAGINAVEADDGSTHDCDEYIGWR